MKNNDIISNNNSVNENMVNNTNKKGISRRRFIASTAAITAFTIIPRRVMGLGYVAPSDKITLAHIGCGIQGFAELGPLMASPDIQIVAVCDPETDGRNYLSFGNGANGVPTSVADRIRGYMSKPEWRKGINYVPGGRMVMKETVETFYANEKPGEKNPVVNAYADFRELLDKEDIDAVKIMTPDHLHATVALHAMKKGKHIITHKPLANRLYESDLVIKTAKEKGVATYFMPYNSYDDLSLIKSWIDDDAIGTLREIHEWSNRPMWKQFTEIPEDKPAIPQGFDWQLWLGPEKDRAYNPCYTHTLFRGWYDFGGGSFADMGHYSMWAVCDTFGLDVPAYATGFGSLACNVENFATGSVTNDFSFPLASTMRLHYNANKSRGPIDLVWYDGGMKPAFIPELDEDKKSMPRSGMMFVGDKGKILGGRIIPENKMKAYKGQQPPEQGPRIQTPAYYKTKSGYSISNLPPEFDKFIDACRGASKNTPGNFQSAEALSTMINLGIVSLRANARVEFDAVSRKITNLPDANKYLVRDYRKGWEL